MEGVLGNTSEASPNAVSVPRIGIVPILPQGKYILWMVIRAVLFGCVAGVVITAVVRFIPYNRVVVYDQPVSPTIQIETVKLAKPGFVIIYMQDVGGWRMVGLPRWLRPGTYRHMVMPIGITPIEIGAEKDNDVGNYIPRNFVIRIHEDVGEKYVFLDNVDPPMKTVFGKTYQKRFWFTRHRSLRQLMSRFIDAPLVELWDRILP